MEPRRRQMVPLLEPLEGRMVLSAVRGPTPFVSVAGNLADGSGTQAIFDALNGGAGKEFVTLIRRGIPNLGTVIRQFAAGQRTSLQVKGFAVKIPKLQPQYHGPQLDQFNPTASGAVLLQDGRLELAAIMRGPIDLPVPTTYVWGIDRGAAASDPEGFGLPRLRYDATVSVTRVGSEISARITDLRTGEVRDLDPSVVKIDGPTIRVFLAKPAQWLPSTGKPVSKYRFGFWTRSGDQAGLSDVGSFVPGNQSIPIGVLGKVRR